MAKRYSVDSIKNWIQKAEAESGAQSVSGPRKSDPRSVNRKPTEKKPVKRKSSSKKIMPKSSPNLGSKAVLKSTVQRKQHNDEQHPNPLALLLDEIGLEREVTSTMTFGELRQVAEVDMPTFHGWRFLGRPMPAEAIAKLREYFQKLQKLERT